MNYLAVYDIADPKRLRRIAKLMESYGYRVQKSVFECCLTRNNLKEFIKLVTKLLNPDHDSVRIYPLPADARLNQTIIGIGDISPEQRCFVA